MAKAVAVEPQVFDVLVHLLRHRDRVVSKEELLDEVWGDRFVSESALTSRIKAARRAIGDDGASQRIIRTLHGRGYRFVADVDELAPSGADAPRRPRERTSNVLQQRVQLCTGRRTVCTSPTPSVGTGPTLVKAANWLSHLDYDWESPVWRHWWRELSARYQLVRYDERGCGLSDWDVEDFSLEAWVADLETVVDAAGLDRFVLLGISQGGPVAITYAARHPERVRGLILFGTFLQGRRIRATNGAGGGRGSRAGAAGAPRLGPGQLRVPPGVRHAVHAGGHAAAVGGVRRAAAPDHLHRQRRAVRRGVRRHRRHEHRRSAWRRRAW